MFARVTLSAAAALVILFGASSASARNQDLYSLEAFNPRGF